MTQVSVKAENLSGETAQYQSPEADDTSFSLQAYYETLFDHYVDIADKQGMVPSVVGTDPETKNPVFDYLERESVAELIKTDLRRYVRVAFVENGLQLDPEYVMTDAPITSLDELVEAYIESEILKARVRVQARGVLATHVTAQEVDIDPAATRHFAEVIKGLGKNARKLIGSAVHYHSGEIPVNHTTPIPSEELKAIVRK